MNKVRSIDKLELNKGCCTQCKHDERLLSNTIFQDNKLLLNVLLYGLFLIFTAKKRNLQLPHVFHSIGKRMLPLCYAEYEWRFNHRKNGSFLERISTYIRQSNIATRKMIRSSIDLYAHTRGLQSV